MDFDLEIRCFLEEIGILGKCPWGTAILGERKDNLSLIAHSAANPIKYPALSILPNDFNKSASVKWRSAALSYFSLSHPLFLKN